MKSYTVLAEGWLTNARGHGAHYVPAGEGEKPVTIELLPEQATYLIASGQIADPDAPEPGEAKGHPAGGVTGEALALSDGERAAIQAGPDLGAGDGGTALAQGYASSDLPAPGSAGTADAVALGVEAPGANATEVVGTDATARPKRTR